MGLAWEFWEASKAHAQEKLTQVSPNYHHHHPAPYEKSIQTGCRQSECH